MTGDFCRILPHHFSPAEYDAVGQSKARVDSDDEGVISSHLMEALIPPPLG